MASALHLRYALPQLLLHRRPDAAAVQLRLRALGRHIIFYVCTCTTMSMRFSNMYWICLDALAAAPLLAGALDDTARALRRDARLAALWSRLTYRLCRRVLADHCDKNCVPVGRTFMSLPADIKAAILARLVDGEDLAAVECTCVALRRLVAEHDAALWKPRYEELLLIPGVLISDEDTTMSPEMIWKERYVAAARRRPMPSESRAATMAHLAYLRELEPILAELWQRHHRLPLDSFAPFDSDDSLELREETAPRRRKRWRAMHRDAGSQSWPHGHMERCVVAPAQFTPRLPGSDGITVDHARL
uniref:F-box domain-containing protein n=1 Tax=Leersia perrieri TaxID=77586 RepID=A0A0D9XHJ2_9ORYZ